MDNKEIIALIKREVVPAIGCTEPAAVALCTAYATEALGCRPERIDVALSANMLKNAMGVGIPGTGMTGLPIAVALGALIGKSGYSLEVLKDVCPQAVEEAKAYLAGNPVHIGLTADSDEVLYIEVRCEAGERRARAVIARDHTRLVYLEGPDGPKVDRRAELGRQEAETAGGDLTLRRVFEFATTAPLADLEFINESRRLNEAAAEAALKGNYGHELGKTLSRPLGKGIMGDSIFSHIISATSCACDARMAGAKIPVMSNSGSGNQGIAATLPVWVFAKERLKSEEDLTRALMLSHLTVIYIKQSFGRLSPLCGCVVAATGSACGLTYLMGGTYEQIVYAVKNMIANITGMICDGAKPSCSLKVATGVSTAVLSSMLAIEDEVVTSAEGIIDDDVDRCVQNMASIGTHGMAATDSLVLDIMTRK